MQVLEDRLKELGEGVSRHAPLELRPTPRALRRIRVGRAIRGSAVLATIAALVIGGFAGARSLSSDEALPPANPDSKEGVEMSGGMWPQSSLEEAERAQRLADAGDPRYTWQLFPEGPPFGVHGAGQQAWRVDELELFNRFLREELGWEKFSFGVGPDPIPLGWPRGFVVLRCAPGGTNDLYANDPDGRECAPTLDENRYETVRINANQPVRDTWDPLTDSNSGIWVVTGWEMLEPSDAPANGIEVHGYEIQDIYETYQIQQVEPLSEAKATEFLRSFLQARVDGQGAQQYTNKELGPSPLYTSISGAPFERFELELMQGPVWPFGWMGFEVRMFPQRGRTEMEPLFVQRRADGRPIVTDLGGSDGEVVYGRSWTKWIRP